MAVHDGPTLGPPVGNVDGVLKRAMIRLGTGSAIVTVGNMDQAMTAVEAGSVYSVRIRSQFCDCDCSEENDRGELGECSHRVFACARTERAFRASIARGGRVFAVRDDDDHDHSDDDNRATGGAVVVIVASPFGILHEALSATARAVLPSLVPERRRATREVA